MILSTSRRVAGPRRWRAGQCAGRRGGSAPRACQDAAEVARYRPRGLDSHPLSPPRRCRVGRVGALWWRDNWPAARAAFRTCGGGVTIVISTGVRDRCGRLLCSKPKAGRLGGPWKAETDRASRHTRCMVAGIERCILCGSGADGQRFLLCQTYFAERCSACQVSP